MAFFGLDSNMPHGSHNKSSTGFPQDSDIDQDPSHYNDEDDFNAYEDTYDGLGEQLDETGDDFNDDTFGIGGSNAVASKAEGKEYDFFGRTATISNAISEGQAKYAKQIPNTNNNLSSTNNCTQLLSESLGNKYDRYKDPDHIPDMLVDASIWGPKFSTPAPASVIDNYSTLKPGPDKRRMMSVEELESSMLGQSKTLGQQPVQSYQNHHEPQTIQPEITQREQEYGFYQHPKIAPQTPRAQYPQKQTRPSQENQFQHNMRRLHEPKDHVTSNTKSPISHAGQNQKYYPTEQQRTSSSRRSSNHSFPSGPQHVIQPRHTLDLTEEERANILVEDAKREKRNYKIFLLSKDNGLMTPQDKNYITRIQLQQLVATTGNPNEHGNISILQEDFYYQVHNQIRGGARNSIGNAGSPKTGASYGSSRRQPRGSISHMQQMEQQVQRAVEAAKNKPKNKQLVIEGSLGKISFSNAKTPKTLLNIRLPESLSDVKAASAARDRKVAQSSVSGSDRKTVLTDIENVYNTLMQMEDLDRQIPPPISENDVSSQLVNSHITWREKAHKLNQKLWHQLKVHEPIGATTTHPFIAILSFGKGMKAMPRVFRHISHEQRTTILTIIIVHLDQLVVVRQGILQAGEIELNNSVRESIEIFSLSVMPPLFSYLNETGLDIVSGIMGLLLNLNIDLIARTRIGLSMLTMILSRAELIKQSGTVSEQHEWEQWLSIYNRFFDTLEPTIPNIFPGTVSTGEDIFVWQFLAAVGIGASAEQQQRLVIAVKDRVMEIVTLAKTLSPAVSSQRLANVNLFMRSIGLDVQLLA